MNKSITIPLIIFIFLIFVITETTLVNFPFVYIFLSALLVLHKKNYTTIGAFVGGLIIDSVRVNGFGLTPLFLLFTILVILLYERYSGSSDLLLACVIITLFAFIYSHLLMYSMTLTVVFMVLSFVIWQFFRILQRKGAISL